VNNDDKKSVAISSLADVAVCERRIYLRSKLGKKISQDRALRMIRGTAVHKRAEKQSHPSERTRDRRCFVATAIYGGDGQETNLLRRFRDQSLMPNAAGRLLVAAYYKLSPKVVQLGSRFPFILVICRAGLDKFVAYLTRRGV
jgi:hypothetical protein